MNRIRNWDFRLITILLVASLARCILPGASQLIWDESRILYDAMMLARHGRWIWLTANQSTFIFPAHSAFTDYVLAIPFLFTADPIWARLFTGLLGVLTVALVYLMVKRYFGQPAATIGGFLLAVSAPAIEFSRYAWNPNVAPPFIALWMFTGLLGYYEGKRWAQTVHWLLLGCAFQAHPGNILLLPLTLVLLLRSWFPPVGTPRLFSVKFTLLGWALTALSFVPFGIGLVSSGFSQNLDTATKSLSISPYSATAIITTYASLVGSTTFEVVNRAHSGPGNWWPDISTVAIRWFQTFFVIAGVVWLIVRGIRDRKNGFPGLFIALVAVLPMLIYVFAPFQIAPHYVMAVLYAAYAVLGVVLGKLFSRSVTASRLVVGIVAIFAGLQIWLEAANIRWETIDGNLERFRAPMMVHQDLVREWANRANDVVILTETQEGKYGPTEQERLWLVVTEGYSVRLDRMRQGIPIAAGGTLVVSPVGGKTIPAYFGQGETEGQLSNGDPMFRLVQVSPAMLPKPNILPGENRSRFSNGVHILGIYAERPPAAGTVWPITLLWQPEQNQVSEQYQFSIRLIDDTNTYAQSDDASLVGYLWRQGDTIVNRFELPVSKDLPPDHPLKVQILMYTWPQMKNVNVTDDQGNQVAQWLALPIPSTENPPPQ